MGFGFYEIPEAPKIPLPLENTNCTYIGLHTISFHKLREMLFGLGSYYKRYQAFGSHPGVPLAKIPDIESLKDMATERVTMHFDHVLW